MDQIAFGPRLVSRMNSDFDYSTVIERALNDGHFASKVDADVSLHAFLQWIALVPKAGPGLTYVMLKCPVDDIFHSLLEDETLYREFCSRFFGFEIIHHPSDDSVLSALPAGVAFTVALLEEVYGDDLNPELKKWRGLLDADAYVVSCVPVRHCPNGSSMGATVMGDLMTGGHIIH